MRYIIFFFIIFIILCCPFPLKILLIFSESKFKFQIYNFNIQKKHIKKINGKSNKIIEFIDSFNKIKFITTYILKQHSKKRKMPFIKSNKSIKCNITLNIIFGFEDPCYTAFFYPGIISLLNELQIYSLKYIKYKKVNSKIYPDFNKKIFNIAFSGIFYVPLGKIIHIVFLILKALKKYKVRGEAHGTSN